MEINNQLKDELNNLTFLNQVHQDPILLYDFISSLCGENIGSGVYRDVFVSNLNHDHVIKVEREGSNCNMVEAMIWEEIREFKNDLAWVKKWFAPVHWISPNGRILVMTKTNPKDHGRYTPPKKIPAFMWDVKLDNFGWIGKNYVCHDYAQFHNMIHYPKKMKNANWYNVK